VQNKRQKGDVNAVVISIIMHLALFVLLILSSLYHNVDIMGGGEGDDGEVIGAVMVDTGSAAQEWGRIQQQKKGQAEKQKKQSAGISISNGEIKILDLESLEEKPLNQEGMIYFSSPSVFSGYQDSKIASPFISLEGKKRYKT